MRLTQFSDYALRMMMFAAANSDRLVTIDETARVFSISQAHLTKVANLLTKSGFLTATRGRSGGLRFILPASSIRLGDIVRATEPDFAIAECLGNNNNCRISPRCKLKTILNDALRAFFTVLDQHSLQDLLLNPEDFDMPRIASHRENPTG